MNMFASINSVWPEGLLASGDEVMIEESKGK
jgi:hypothetical protein